MPRAALLLALLLGTGCGGRTAFLAEALSPSAQAVTFHVRGEAFRLLSVTTGAAPRMQGVYLVSGSGCTALPVYLAPYLRDLPPGYVIFGLDKAGVPRRSLGLACSPAFRDTDTMADLIRRNRVGLSLARAASPVPVSAVIGISEGGLVAATLAARAPGIDRLVMIASGGMTQRQELMTLAESRGDAAAMSRRLARVKDAPDSTTDRVLGLPHRDWSAVLDPDPAETLRQVTVPALVIIGAGDQSVPVASARRAAGLLPDGRLVVIPDASHTFRTPDGNRRATVMALIDAFLRD